jgi:hypothetical protein
MREDDRNLAPTVRARDRYGKQPEGLRALNAGRDIVACSICAPCYVADVTTCAKLG